MRISPLILTAFLLPFTAHASPVPKDSRQLVVAISPDWNSSTAQVWLAQRARNDAPWQVAAGPIPCRLGSSGMAWGRGLHAPPHNSTMKCEGDGKTPCGAFAIGKVFGTLDPATVERRSKLGYVKIGPGDLWVEDVNSEYYNRHIKLPGGRPAQSEWEHKQQMKLGDDAHKLKLFIAHNAPPQVVRGGGSAIFFHIWRQNGSRPTSGCTTMREDNLRQLIAWIDPAAKPVYVALPRPEYRRLAKHWQLPAL